jgi:esterase
MPWLKSNGIMLHYLEWGNRSSPAIVLIHGLTGCAAIWEGVAVRLAEAGYRVVAPDLREHGRSAKTGDPRLIAYAADVIGLIEQAGHGAVHLVGHSFGAAVAWEIAASRSDLVKRLVLEDHHPDAALSTLPYWLEWAEEWRWRFETREEAIAYLTAEGRSLAWWEPSLVSLPHGGWGWAFDKAMMVETIRQAYMRDYWDRLAVITAPTLLLRGAESSHLSPDVAKRMVETIPDARLVTVAGADHWIHREAGPYAERVLAFLGASTGSPEPPRAV